MRWLANNAPVTMLKITAFSVSQYDVQKYTMLTWLAFLSRYKDYHNMCEEYSIKAEWCNTGQAKRSKKSFNRSQYHALFQIHLLLCWKLFLATATANIWLIMFHALLYFLLACLFCRTQTWRQCQREWIVWKWKILSSKKYFVFASHYYFDIFWTFDLLCQFSVLQQIFLKKKTDFIVACMTKTIINNNVNKYLWLFQHFLSGNFRCFNEISLYRFHK